MGKGGPRYTPDEARGRIPEVVRRMVLEGIDLMIQLDHYPIDSREVESRVVAVSGLAGHLYRLCSVVWKYEALRRATAEKMV